MHEQRGIQGLLSGDLEVFAGYLVLYPLRAFESFLKKIAFLMLFIFGFLRKT